MKSIFYQESALVTYQDEIIYITIGNASSVEFDFLHIWEKLKQKSPILKDHLHFFHSHATDWDFCSSIDVRCMKALNIAFGYPINFWILALEKNLKLYRFENDQVECIKSIEANDFANTMIEDKEDTMSVKTIDYLLSHLSRIQGV